MSENPLRRAVLVLVLLVMVSGTLAAQEGGSESAAVRVYAHTLQHASTQEVMTFLRPLLSPRGTVEEQPGGNTLVIRDTRAVMAEVIPLLEILDRPPRDLRLEIHVIRAGSRQQGSDSASGQVTGSSRTLVEAGVAQELVERLRALLRYEDYEVVAQAGVSSREGEDVTYALDPTYNVSFQLGRVMADLRLRLEGFQIVKKFPNPANKGRQLEPRELFHATLNLWQDRPVALVLTRDEDRQEALLVAISWRQDGSREEEAP